MARACCVLHLLAALSVAAGCGGGGINETLPSRSAFEQLLISTAADRALADLPQDAFQDHAVYVETRNLECLDRGYVIQQIGDRILAGHGRLARDADRADLILEVASGGLSIGKRDYLLGIPAITLPLPFMGGASVSLPEVRLLKFVQYRGKVKLVFSAVTTATGGQAFGLPPCHGTSKDSYFTVLFIGPIRFTDLPDDAR
jgi:hypothetical protein